MSTSSDSSSDDGSFHRQSPGRKSHFRNAAGEELPPRVGPISPLSSATFESTLTSGASSNSYISRTHREEPAEASHGTDASTVSSSIKVRRDANQSVSTVSNMDWVEDGSAPFYESGSSTSAVPSTCNYHEERFVRREGGRVSPASTSASGSTSGKSTLSSLTTSNASAASGASAGSKHSSAGSKAAPDSKGPGSPGSLASSALGSGISGSTSSSGSLLLGSIAGSGNKSSSLGNSGSSSSGSTITASSLPPNADEAGIGSSSAGSKPTSASSGSDGTSASGSGSTKKTTSSTTTTSSDTTSTTTELKLPKLPSTLKSSLIITAPKPEYEYLRDVLSHGVNGGSFETDRFSALERTLEQFQENARHIGVIASDFSSRSQENFNQKIHTLFTGLQEIERARHNFEDVRIPLELLTYLDEGKNPEVYNKECMEKALQKNKEINGKIEMYRRFRGELLKSLGEEMPDETQAYRTLREVEVKKETDLV